MTHLPQPVAQPQPVWARFSADPRHHGPQRAADHDRDVAASVLNDAFSDGRLDRIEHAERLDAVMASRTLGDLVPLLSDLVVAGRPTVAGAVKSPKLRSVAVRTWLGLAALFNAIWLMTVMTRGRLMYYWPMWPMLGTAIPLLITWMVGRAVSDQRPRALEQ